MPYRSRPSGADRAKAIAGVVMIYGAALAALLLIRTSVPAGAPNEAPPVLIDISEPPPPPPEAQAGKAREEEGTAGKKAEPTEVVAPKPPVELPTNPPLPAAPIAGSGTSSSAGAANTGTGPGAGGSGTGRGGGAGGGAAAQWVSGGLQNSDYPRDALRSRLTGRVSVRFTVLTNGRISNCRVVASSGSPLLDATTCRLLTERLRFRPARNSAGAPIESEIGSDYTWGINFRRY